MQQRPRLALAVLAALALGALVFGVVVGAGRDGEEEPAPGAVPERAGRSLDRTSFLARVVPPAERRERQARGPNVPRSVADLAKRLPLERKVAQLFLFGFRGADLNAEIFRRLRRLDLGGIVVGPANYSDPSLLGQLGGEAIVISRDVKHVPPWVLTVQDGGEFNSLPGLPPASAPADIGSAAEAGELATDTAKTLRGLNVTGVLGPVLDVGLPSGSALGARVYSDEPDEVARYADAVVTSYRAERLFGAARHFPGLGAADQSTELGPASVGLGLEELRERDLIAFTRRDRRRRARHRDLARALPDERLHGPGLALARRGHRAAARRARLRRACRSATTSPTPRSPPPTPCPTPPCSPCARAPTCSGSPARWATSRPPTPRCCARRAAGASRADRLDEALLRALARQEAYGADRLNLDAVVVEGRRAAELGQPLRGGGLAAAAVARSRGSTSPSAPPARPGARRRTRAPRRRTRRGR